MFNFNKPNARRTDLETAELIRKRTLDHINKLKLEGFGHQSAKSIAMDEAIEYALKPNVNEIEIL